MSVEHWKSEPEDHDFPAAVNYLSLLCSEEEAEKIVNALRGATNQIYAAKDLLRASGLSLLPKDNAHVKSDLEKISKGHHLSPVLLVRAALLGDHPLIIADGYHRVCTSYWIEENAAIPCRIVTWAE